MNNFNKTLSIMLLTMSSMILFKLGLDWMHVGYGLNPIAAFPLSTLVFISTFFVLPTTQRNKYK